MELPDERPLTAIPTRRARFLAFAAIVLGGLAGGVTGWAYVDVQCHGECTTETGLGALAGGVIAAAGVAIVAVLALRAMGEWRRIEAEQQQAESP